MILVCENCSTSLQLDEKKAPSGKFTIRCPKCKSLVSVSVGVGSQNAAENPAESAANGKPSQQTAPHKPAAGAATGNPATQTAGAGEDVLRLLTNLLNQKNANGFDNSPAQPERSVLICVPPEQREKTAQLLNENGWKPFIAESATQALETLGEIKIENVVLASNFAPEQRGALLLQNHFFGLSPTQRRRVFLIYLDERAQAATAHEAFLRNLNFIVNAKDLPSLPQILRRERRDFDETYRHFKNALADA